MKWSIYPYTRIVLPYIFQYFCSYFYASTIGDRRNSSRHTLHIAPSSFWSIVVYFTLEANVVRAAYVEDIKIKCYCKWKSRFTESTKSWGLGSLVYFTPLTESINLYFSYLVRERRTTCGVVIVMTLRIQESKDYMNHQNQHAITGCTNNTNH